MARGHDANAVLELYENGTEATRAGDYAAGGALPLRKPGPPVPDVVIVLGHVLSGGLPMTVGDQLPHVDVGK